MASREFGQSWTKDVRRADPSRWTDQLELRPRLHCLMPRVDLRRIQLKESEPPVDPPGAPHRLRRLKPTAGGLSADLFHVKRTLRMPLGDVARFESEESDQRQLDAHEHGGTTWRQVQVRHRMSREAGYSIAP